VKDGASVAALDPSGVTALFRECGALLEGHFLLSSGLHSNRYLQCALILQHPDKAARLGAAIAALFWRDRIGVVVGPALGGVVIAHEVARALGVRSIFTERANGAMTLRRGFRVERGERALVTEDVVTTGGSTREVMDVIGSGGAVVQGVASIVNRAGSNPFAPLPFRALLDVEVPTWETDVCPLCRSGEAGPAVKPGSRVAP
jgi:orotate phosphoribosyltransferase